MHRHQVSETLKFMWFVWHFSLSCWKCVWERERKQTRISFIDRNADLQFLFVIMTINTIHSGKYTSEYRSTIPTTVTALSLSRATSTTAATFSPFTFPDTAASNEASGPRPTCAAAHAIASPKRNTRRKTIGRRERPEWAMVIANVRYTENRIARRQMREKRHESVPEVRQTILWHCLLQR